MRLRNNERDKRPSSPAFPTTPAHSQPTPSSPHCFVVGWPVRPRSRRRSLIPYRVIEFHTHPNHNPQPQPKMRSALFALVAAVAGSVNAITVLEALRANAGTAQVAAAIAAHPEWAAATPKTLIVPTDASIVAARARGNLAPTDLGFVFLPTAVDHRDKANYKVLKAPQTALLFDNYVPAGPPEIHVRSSTQQGLITKAVNCDDGFFYVSNIPFEAAVVPSKAIVANPAATSFLAAFTKLGLVATLDSLTDVTIFVPTEAAMAAAAPALAALTPNQLAFVLATHIVRPAKFSTEQDNVAMTSLSGLALPYTVVGETASLGGAAIGTLVDVPTSAGAIHTLNSVIIPGVANLPPAAPGAPTMFGTIPIVAGGATAPNSTVSSVVGNPTTSSTATVTRPITSSRVTAAATRPAVATSVAPVVSATPSAAATAPNSGANSIAGSFAVVAAAAAGVVGLAF
ncbi:uncharacterized protein EV422DRAFT_515880 [Fimicolochytrium jonesii]|uniref:uncharacterized protein n=1 Tax=Fimicolochytrium jonesii TaxID=1396493 RepID=UPI0022FED134|nr:uncharacterized protein EV422DRAFT_515880 [Fimicolochytrium jonesii]KAI8826234.1 hypothetical protein EV422DRAFT_515880 [Fimicolochytrium jonesii]